MLTTTPSSKISPGLNLRQIIGRGIVFLVLGAFSVGCFPPQAKLESFFETTPEMAKNRSIQTRTFEIQNEKELLSASAAVLQDLGFQVEEISVEAGMLKAAKERSARETGQEIGQAFVLIGSIAGAIFGMPIIQLPVDLHQQIGATLITRRDENHPTRYIVRILFHRTVWKSDGAVGRQHIPPGEQWMEMVNDPLIYQQFFAKLSKGLFLEAHEI